MRMERGKEIGKAARKIRKKNIWIFQHSGISNSSGNKNRENRNGGRGKRAVRYKEKKKRKTEDK